MNGVSPHSSTLSSSRRSLAVQLTCSPRKNRRISASSRARESGRPRASSDEIVDVVARRASRGQGKLVRDGSVVDEGELADAPAVDRSRSRHAALPPPRSTATVRCGAGDRRDRAPTFGGQTGHRLELLAAGVEQPRRPRRSGAAARRGGARPTPGRSSSSDVGLRCARAGGGGSVIAKRCASSRMRCSSSRPARVALEPHRRRAAGHEDLLLALGERDDGDARQVELAHRRERRGELALAAVDHDQVRERRERAVVALLLDQPVAGEAPAHGLGDRAEVVLSLPRGGSRTGGSRACAARPPRTRPSTRRAASRRGSRRRSTRCAPAAPRGRAPRAAPRAPRRGGRGCARRRAPRGAARARRCARRARASAASRRAPRRAPRPASRDAPRGTPRAPRRPRARTGTTTSGGTPTCWA